MAQTERKYKGLMVVLDKRFSNRWQGRVSYVWSQTRGYLSNSGSNTYGPDSLWETPTNMLVNSYGKPLYDRPHELKLFATWQIPKIEVGLNGYYRYLSGHDLRARTSASPPGTSTTRRRPAASRSSSRAAAAGSTPRASSTCASRRSSRSAPARTASPSYADIQNVFNSGTVVGRERPLSHAVGDAGGRVESRSQFGAPTEIIRPAAAAPRREVELLVPAR